MADKNPLGWFPSYCMASIRLKKVDRWARSQAERHPNFHPYFDTWEEAHRWLLKKALSDHAKSAKELESDRKRLEKVIAMTAPDKQEADRAA